MAHREAEPDTLRRLVRALPYFSDLDERVIDDVVRSMVVRKIPAGRTIFLEGQRGDEAPLYMVVDGAVRVFKSSVRGREQVLRLFHAGDTFGEVPLYDGGPYPASAAAQDEVTLAALPRRLFLQLVKEHPEIAVATIRVMGERLRHFNSLIEDLSLRRVISRVARLLVAEREDELTQSQMAAMIGTSREMVNRSLHRLEDEGVIEIRDHHQIAILDPNRLSAIIDEG